MFFTPQYLACPADVPFHQFWEPDLSAPKDLSWLRFGVWDG